ncbi:Adiponectin [Varanus komodoensis]|nr:Adiponectin [Varanus komodoensis]
MYSPERCQEGLEVKEHSYSRFNMKQASSLFLCSLVLLLKLCCHLEATPEEDDQQTLKDQCENWMRGPPGYPGHNGVPGRDGRDGNDGQKGEKGEQDRDENLHRKSSKQYPGRVLRPVLFNIFINDLNKEVPEMPIRIASDTKLGGIANPLEDRNKIQSDLNRPESTPGLKGDTGGLGAAGADGPQGAPGLNGIPGLKGEKGEGGSIYRSAFSVGLTTRVPFPNVPIKFTKIFYNEQNHYDVTTGKFRCSIPGVYYFSYHLTVYVSDVKVSLYKKDKAVIITYDQYQTNDVDQASGSVLLHLEIGDEVWLQVYGEGENNGIYADNVNDSTFMGFLLYVDLDYAH